MAGTLKQKRRRQRRRKRILIVLIIILILLALAFITVWKVFVVKEVDVVGNEIYSEEQIENWIFNDDYSWNSLYVFFKSRITKQEEIPFVDTMEVTLDSPTKLTVTVTEKGMLGYVYVPDLGEYAYFDQDGFVVELSNDLIRDVMHITGLDVENAVLYEKLDFNGITLKSLLTLTQLLQKYNRQPDAIYIRDSDILLSFGDIQVDLGNSTDITAKIVRMDEILTKVSGRKGTLHMDGWSENTGNIYFKPDEVVQIPAY